MKTALMVAEKPSLAAALAKILSNGKHITRKGTISTIVLFVDTFFPTMQFIPSSSVSPVSRYRTTFLNKTD